MLLFQNKLRLLQSAMNEEVVRLCGVQSKLCEPSLTPWDFAPSNSVDGSSTTFFYRIRVK